MKIQVEILNNETTVDYVEHDGTNMSTSTPEFRLSGSTSAENNNDSNWNKYMNL